MPERDKYLRDDERSVATITYRIPAERWDATIESLRGSLQRKGISFTDVGQILLTMYLIILGRVIEHLKQSGQYDNTVVIFTSDNGGRVPTTSNKSLRFGKASAYEGGVRVPLIVRWPGVVKPGSTVGHVVSNVDTFASILGMPYMGTGNDPTSARELPCGPFDIELPPELEASRAAPGDTAASPRCSNASGRTGRSSGKSGRASPRPAARSSGRCGRGPPPARPAAPSRSWCGSASSRRRSCRCRWPSSRPRRRAGRAA